MNNRRFISEQFELKSALMLDAQLSSCSVFNFTKGRIRTSIVLPRVDGRSTLCTRTAVVHKDRITDWRL